VGTLFERGQILKGILDEMRGWKTPPIVIDDNITYCG